jgi:hypothetical protein
LARERFSQGNAQIREVLGFLTSGSRPHRLELKRKGRCLMSSKLVEFFNKQPRLGALATADRSGRVNVAYFNSLRMLDETTVVMGLGKNRTLANLQENPHAAFMILEPGKTLDSWKGIRVYLKMKSCETQGPLLEEIKGQIEKFVGRQAASMIQAAVTFQVTEIRPLADFGQGWEKSI